jgi:hypothetical protein
MDRHEHKQEAERLLEHVEAGVSMLSTETPNQAEDEDEDEKLLRLLDLDVARAHVHALLAAAPDDPPTPDH